MPTPPERPFLQTVTIESIDAAIIDWFDRTVDAHVEGPTNSRVKVPVRLGSGERWATGREKKGTRDALGQLILPIISIRRTAVDPDLTMQALGTETPTIQIAKRISPKTNNLQVLNNAAIPSLRFPTSPVVYEVTTIPFPERKVMTYEIQIQAQYVTQMNAILEKIWDNTEMQNSFVAVFDNVNRVPPKGEEFENRKPLSSHYVVGFFDSTNSAGGNFDEFTDQERIVQYNTTIRVPAVLQLDPEGTKPAIKVERTSFNLQFNAESTHFVDDPYELELIFSNGKLREK